ncbi:MAG: hypothetical protein U1C51_07795, partial [Candidatus Izemoplasmatales bacterium]|nr:hypothetical protein [Candidatus Izemoplasmatales bacterium]
MKKVLLIVFAFVTILAFSFTPVKADHPNLFNPSPGDYAVEHFDGTLYRIRLMYSLDLLENHQYQLSLSLDNAQSYQDIYDDLYNISINLSWNFFFNFGTDAFSNFNSNVSIPFETSPGMTQLHFYIETYWNSLNDATYYMNTFFKDVFNSNNIQVVLTGQVAPIDEVEPEFTYSNLQFNAFYYDLPTVQGIQSQLTAIDDQDGDVSDRIVIENDQYTGQTIFVGGEYYILFSVDDLAGNKAYLRVNVNIVDDLAPVATYDGQTLNDYDTIFFSWYDDDDYPKKLTESEIADLIYFFDEIDQLALDIQILVNYTGEESFYNVPGIHMLEVSATDYSGNIIRILVQVEV